MQRRPLCRLAVRLALVAGLCAITDGQLARGQPSLSHVMPAAVAPGRTTELTLYGTKLDGPLSVWTSFPAQVEPIAGDSKQQGPTSAKFKLTLSAGVPLGVGGIVIANRSGASDAVYMMVDDLPSLAEQGDNHTPNTAQPIAPPIAVDGQSDGTQADYFCFAAKAGQTTACEVLATRLGWDFDALVRVLDASGKELLLADDDPATGPDARFTFTAPADGQYVIEIRDNRFKAGGRYRLRFGDFPLVSAPLPLVAQRGAATNLSWRGPLGVASPAVTLFPLGGSFSTGSCSLGATAPGKKGSAFGLVGLTDLPVAMRPPSASAEQPTTIELPCVVSGALGSPSERGLFEFQANKGTQVRFKAITRSFGSPAVVILRVLDAAGKQLVENPVTESDEPVLSFNPPADGKYRLAVEELVGRGGPDYVYAVECRTGPQFALLLKNDKNNRLKYAVAESGAFTLDVQCQRAGYDGPIALAIDAPHSGWQLINSTIPARANEVRTYVLPPAGFPAGSVADLRIVGRGEAAGRVITAVMTTTVQLRAARPQTPYPPAWQDGTIFVAGLGDTGSFFHVAAAASSVPWDAAAGQAVFTLAVERADPKFKDPVTIVPIGLPGGVTAEVKRNASGPKETYEVVLKSKQPPQGEHTFRCLAYGELNGQGRGIMTGGVRLTHPAGSQSQPAAGESAKSP